MAGTEPPPRHPRASSAPQPPAARFVVALRGGVAPEQVATLCAELRARLEAIGRPCTVTCDVEAIGRPDVSTIDALARLTLTARQCGSDVAVVGANAALDELVALVGLSRVIRLGSVEPWRQAEEREERLGVEEERDPGDAVG